MMAKPATRLAPAPASPSVAVQTYDYTRLGAITHMSPDELTRIFGEDVLGDAVRLKQRPAMFVRLAVIRLLQSGIDPEIVQPAAELLAELFDYADPIRDEAWLLLSQNAREVVTARPYLFDAVARAGGTAITVLDIAQVWRAVG